MSKEEGLGAPVGLRGWACLGVFGVNPRKGSFTKRPAGHPVRPPALPILPRAAASPPLLVFCPHCHLRYLWSRDAG